MWLESLTWWEFLLMYIVIFAAFFGVGALLGLIAASASVAVLNRNGVVLKRRHRIAVSLLGATVGAIVNYMVAIYYYCC